MKQLVMSGPGQSKLVDAPIPEIKADEILVKMKYCGVCRSEHDAWKEAQAGKRFGHEPVGVVDKVGQAVTGFKPGDRVSGLASPALAEYVVFNAAHTVHVPDGLDDEDATAEPLSCLVSAVLRLPLKPYGEPAAVVGCGYMGLGALSLMRMRMAGPIIAVDKRLEALEAALKFGATEVYLPEEVPQRYLATWENGCKGGLPVVTEWAESNEALNLAARMTMIDGTLGVGAYHTGGMRNIDMQLWNFKAIMVNSLHERKAGYQTTCCEQALTMLAEGSWKFTGLKHKIYRLDQFDLAQQEIITKPGGIVKGLIDCTKWAGSEG